MKYREQEAVLQERLNSEKDSLPSGRVVAFCVTCMRRGWQLKETLAWNILNALPYGSSCKFFIVLFNKNDPDTVDVLKWLEDFDSLKKRKILHVATAEMPYWDCPQAKNTAHKFAMKKCAKDGYQHTFLVNLDADNGFSLGFVPSVLMYAKMNAWNTFYSWKGDDGGVTGRMGCWSARFEELGGYDEDLHGHGHQDVDLRTRFKNADGGAVVNGLDDTWRRFSAGWSVCNDPDGNYKKAYNEAKMVNTHPDFKNRLSWGQLDGKNKQIAHSKKGSVRNEGRPIGVEYEVVGTGDGVPVGSIPGDGVPVVLRENAKLPMLSMGCWKEDELPIAVYARHYAGFRVPGPGTIRIFSFGVQAAELVMGAKNQYAMQLTRQGNKGGHVHIDESLIGGSLRTARLIDRNTYVVPVDCRMLRDPEYDRRLHRHVGFHPIIIRDVVGNARFSWWLRQTMSLCSDAMELGHKDIVVVMYCKAGNHRSVACQAIVQHLLQATILDKWTIERSVHCSREVWRQRLCNICRTCEAPHEERTQALAAARLVWRMTASDDL